MDGDGQMTKWVTVEGECGRAGEGKKDKVLFVREGPRRAAAAGGLTEGQEIEKTPRYPPLKVG